MRTIEPYFYFWGAILLYFGVIAYHGLRALSRIEAWQRAIAEDIARKRLLK